MLFAFFDFAGELPSPSSPLLSPHHRLFVLLDCAVRQQRMLNVVFPAATRMCVSMRAFWGSRRSRKKRRRRRGAGDEAESAFPILETISNPITEQEKAFFVSFYPRLPPSSLLCPSLLHFISFLNSKFPCTPSSYPLPPLLSPQRESVLLSFYALGEEAERLPCTT